MAGLPPPCIYCTRPPAICRVGYRIIEKASFEPAERVPFRAPRVAASADCAREAIQYSSMANMARGLQYLQDAELSGEILIVRCKNRWAQATGGGWADLLINFCFMDGPAAWHVCELQFGRIGLGGWGDDAEVAPSTL